jgi:transcriptional regulator with XRE-family HTH domain
MPAAPGDLNAALLRLLADARTKEGLSMEALAERAGLDRTYVGLLERGRRQPTVVAAAALSNALGLSLADLLMRAEAEQSDGIPDRLELIPAPGHRLANRSAVESDTDLRTTTGLTADAIVTAIDATYHTLDLLDNQLLENGATPFSKLVELANLSSMIGNIFGGSIARHSGGLFERSGPHKYQDLRSTTGGAHVEIKTALEDNKPKGHLSKAGLYLTLRYVLGDPDGTYIRGQRGEVIYVWEIRFGYLRKSDFAESNTPGDSGKTAVVRTKVLQELERIYFDPRYFPMAKLDGPWGRAGLF